MSQIENILNLIEEHKTELKDSEYKTALEDLSEIRNIISELKSYYSIKVLIVSTTLNKLGGGHVYKIQPKAEVAKYIYQLTE